MPEFATEEVAPNRQTGKATIMYGCAAAALILAAALCAHTAWRQNRRERLAVSVTKTLIGDALAISAAANQYCAENSCTRVTLDKLIGRTGYFGSLARGVRMRSGLSTAPFGETDFATPLNPATIELCTEPRHRSAYFALGHTDYITTNNAYARLRPGGALGYDAGDNFILFSVEDGSPVAKNTTMTTNAAPAGSQIQPEAKAQVDADAAAFRLQPPANPR